MLHVGTSMCVLSAEFVLNFKVMNVLLLFGCPKLARPQYS